VPLLFAHTTYKTYGEGWLNERRWDRMGKFASAQGPPLPAEIREEVEVMEAMGDLKTWGGFDGRGLVILSDSPVEFQPTNKTSNVVMVGSLDDAIRYVNVATQTIGVYPYERKA
jgi:Acyl-CoA reductase (LuxC)